jgi:hypothetical protein
LFALSIQRVYQKIGTIHIQILDAEENFHKEGIKELKLNLGTKNNRSVTGNLKDGTKYSF